MKTKVLMVGAGANGMVLALGLAKKGVRFRIIDQQKGPREASRAMVVHARTLESYQQFGFAQELVNQSIKAEELHIRKDEQEHGKY